MAEIELRNLTKRFGDTTAVAGASFTIRDGEFFVLVGPSGCGKSTLLNMIVGLDEPSGGEVLVDGERVNDLDARDRNMAMVFQSYAIYPHMTVRQNIAFPLKLAGLPKDETARRVARAAGVLGLETVLDRRPHTLSGGQRQRVAMGRALVREPRAFLLDEPLSNLDAKLRVEMRTEIARLQRKLGTTTIWVTHDQTEAMTLGDRIAVLQKGEVLQIGTPRDLYERPASLFVAGFIGSPAMNFLPARRSGDRLDLPVGSIALPEKRREGVEAAGGALVAGFRPEHLQVVGDPGPGSGDLSFDAGVEVVEWLGADLFAWFDVALEGFGGLALPEDLGMGSGGTARHTLVARIAPDIGLKEGDTIRLSLGPDRVQVFDAGSGRNLTPGAAAS